MLTFFLSVSTMESCLGGYQDTELFLSAVLDDLMFIYLWVKVLVISFNNLVTEFFLSNTPICLKLCFWINFLTFIKIRQDSFRSIINIYCVPIFVSFTKESMKLVISVFLLSSVKRWVTTITCEIIRIRKRIPSILNTKITLLKLKIVDRKRLFRL